MYRMYFYAPSVCLGSKESSMPEVIKNWNTLSMRIYETTTKKNHISVDSPYYGKPHADNDNMSLFLNRANICRIP